MQFLQSEWYGLPEINRDWISVHGDDINGFFKNLRKFLSVSYSMFCHVWLCFDIAHQLLWFWSDIFLVFFRLIFCSFQTSRIMARRKRATRKGPTDPEDEKRQAELAALLKHFDAEGESTAVPWNSLLHMESHMDHNGFIIGKFDVMMTIDVMVNGQGLLRLC